MWFHICKSSKKIDTFMPFAVFMYLFVCSIFTILKLRRDFFVFLLRPVPVLYSNFFILSNGYRKIYGFIFINFQFKIVNLLIPNYHLHIYVRSHKKNPHRILIQFYISFHFIYAFFSSFFSLHFTYFLCRKLWYEIGLQKVWYILIYWQVLETFLDGFCS